MIANSIQIIVTLTNEDSVIICEDCPHTSESERMRRGGKLAANMFTVGVSEVLSPSENRIIPPHRIKEIQVKSF